MRLIGIRFAFLLATASRHQTHSLQSRRIGAARMASSDGAPADSKPGCIPCSTMDSSFLLSDEKMQHSIDTEIKLWKLKPNGDNGKSISRKFTARNFQAALNCLNEMGAVAERESHHPDFHLTNYRDLEINLWTHKLGGVTESDIVMAKLLDSEIDIDYSPKWLKANPQAQATAKKLEGGRT